MNTVHIFKIAVLLFFIINPATSESQSNTLLTGSISPQNEELNDNNVEEPRLCESRQSVDKENDIKLPKKCDPVFPTYGADLQAAHVPCPPDSDLVVPKDILYSSDSKEIPELQCKKCDIRLTTDSSGVILRCFDCYDIQPGTNIEVQQNRSEVTVNTLVYFLAIANYTCPEGNTLLNLTIE